MNNVINYYLCLQIRGQTHNGKRIFPNTNCEKRTKASFTAQVKTKDQEQHHQPNMRSPLLRIPGFDPVRHVVLDSMHLLFNGVMKTLLERWIGKKKNRAKLGRIQRNKLREILLALKGSIPTEFQRKTFDLEDVANWKATQFRFFLLYAGPVVLKFVLGRKLYRNFLNLSVASRILCNPTLALTHTEIADNLLNKFFSKLPKLYGENIQVINFHNLIHLADDVRQMQAPLTAYSAFPFENLLGLIKKLIRTPRNPLAQIFRRLSEIDSTSQIMTKIPMFSNRMEITRTISQIDYSDIKLKAFHVSVTHPNNIVELIIGDLIKIQRIFCNSWNVNNVFIEGHELKRKNIFEYPRASSEVGLHISTDSSISSPLKKYPIESIVGKCFQLNIEENVYLFHLLHK